jgi:hypothetical protein
MFASITCTAENWEACFNIAYLLSCCSLSPLSIVEDARFVTLHHLGRLMAQSFCQPQYR